MEIEVAELVEETLAAEARLPDESLRALAEKIEREGDGSCDAIARFASAGSAPGAEAEPWRFRDALWLLHDHFVLRYGVEAFEAERQVLLHRWLEKVRRGG